KISLLARAEPILPPPPPGKAAGYVFEDRAPMAFADAREALDLLHDVGLDAPPGERIPLVEAPLRMELAAAAEGAVLVSDQMYRLIPIERFRKFHSFQLVRAIFELLAARRLAPRERPADLAWSPDAAASW